MILLVEDNPGDALLLQTAFEAEKVKVPIRVVHTAADALEDIRDEHARRPSLVIVDIRLAGEDGWEVLKALAEDEQFAGIPAAVLTSSSRSDDRRRAMELGVTHYFSKPIGLAGYAPIVRALSALHEDSP